MAFKCYAARPDRKYQDMSALHGETATHAEATGAKSWEIVYLGFPEGTAGYERHIALSGS